VTSGGEGGVVCAIHVAVVLLFSDWEQLQIVPKQAQIFGDGSGQLGVQIEYDVVHLRTSLVQLFALLQLNFEEIVQIIELRRFGGAPNGYPFAALWSAEAGGEFPLDPRRRQQWPTFRCSASRERGKRRRALS
jgi:hypothetical protein